MRFLLAFTVLASVTFFVIPKAPGSSPVEPQPPSQLAPISALTPMRPADLALKDGKVYRLATVITVEPDGLTYSHAAGVVKIPFEELPAATRQAYGYHPAQAAAFAAADAANQEAIMAERTREAQTAAAAKAAQVAATLAKLNAPSTAPSGASSEERGHSGNFVISRNSAGSYSVRELGPGVSYLQSVGGGR